jgi:branched-chain amino acid transport system ATP-binding protein
MPILAAETAILDIAGLNVGYGKVAVLHDVGLSIASGTVVALLGPNGAGKTTLLRALSGLLPWSSGTMRFRSETLRRITPREAGQRGLVHVIEGHRVFTQLSVGDNLDLAAYGLPRAERATRVEEALTLFPEIAAKRKDKGGALSGGQQQMLAVAQGLVRRPALLMLDEPSAGLSPVLVDRVLSVLTQLRDQGTAVLLVEQLVDKALAVASHVYALAQGRVVLDCSTDTPDLHAKLERAYLGQDPMAA